MRAHALGTHDGSQLTEAASPYTHYRWGDKGPAPGEAPGAQQHAGGRALPGSLAECGRLVLLTPEPEVRSRRLPPSLRYADWTRMPQRQGKAALTHAAFRAWCTGTLPVGAAVAPDAPARPPLPLLVPIKQVPTPAESPVPLPAHVLLTLAHIELNAMDLAWDTVVRFSTGPAAAVLPPAFFADFARIADDEARHLGWCFARLAELGHAYGSLPAHNQLWEGAAASADDLVERLVVVPCVQEARGLDAGPRLAGRLIGAGDERSAAIVRRIAAEEWAHVAVGAAWLRAVCAAVGRDPGDAFRDAVARHVPDGLKGPFDRHARERVGLPRQWWDAGAPDADAPLLIRRRRPRARNGGGAGVQPAAPDALAGVRSRLMQVVAAEAAAKQGHATLE